MRQQDRLWWFIEQGDLEIAKLATKGYEEIARVHVIEPTNVAFGRQVVWSAPAWANRTVFLRNRSCGIVPAESNRTVFLRNRTAQCSCGIEPHSVPAE